MRYRPDVNYNPIPKELRSKEATSRIIRDKKGVGFVLQAVLDAPEAIVTIVKQPGPRHRVVSTIQDVVPDPDLAGRRVYTGEPRPVMYPDILHALGDTSLDTLLQTYEALQRELE